MKSTMMHYPLTLNHILERAGKLFGATEIVSRLADRSMHRYTYADFYRRSKQLGEALQQAGLKRGDRVGTLMWNSYAHMECYFGIPAAGGVLHTLNLRLFPEDIAFIANHAEDRFIIVDDVLLPLFEKFKDKIKVERVFVFSQSGKPTPAGYEDYEALLGSAQGQFQYPDLDENEPCGMCYTSGTTGQPKGVVYSHRSTVLHAFMAAMPDTTSYSGADTVLPVVPMFHANAWAIPYVCAMVGAKLVFPGPFLDGESLLELYQTEKVTVSAGVPTIWLSLLQTLQQNPGRWQLQPGLRMTIGGSAVPASLIKAYAELDMHIIQGWGMTETSPIATVSKLDQNTRKFPPDERAAAVARQGIVVPFVDIRIMNDEGEAAWDGKSVGEVQVRGPWVTGSYHNLAKSEESFTADGWLKTGDVGMIGSDGYLRLTDRAKDLIKSGGEWISSVDLENSIMGHPAVAEAAVIAVPHPKWAERPLAVVVLKPGQKAGADEIREFLLGKYAKWQIPDGIIFVDAIPRTSTGKFLKTKLREDYKDWKWAS
ncbi:MAG: long-chain fatty acid--CoA ligase [Pseudomonadota bacterium]|nr:long-chain fatty acid--CoA ligase [Pseudomonadota bacterium]